MRPSRRLEQIPPYLFAQLERKIAEKRAAGVDVISLGIGDPDTPTYAPIVAAAQRAVADPSTHTYPTNRGRAEFREAVAGVLPAPLRGDAGPGDRGDGGDRRQGVHLQPQPRVSRSGRCGARVRPGLSGLHRGSAHGRRRAGPARPGPGAGLRARPGRDRRRPPAPCPADVHQLPQQSDRRDPPRGAVRVGDRAGQRPRLPGRPRQRVQRDDLRWLRGAVVSGDSGRPGGRASRCSRSPRATT